MSTLGLALLAAVAVVPLLGELDMAVAAAVDRWQTCGGERVFRLVSDIAPGAGLVALVVLLAWRWAPPRRARREVAEVVAAWGAGVLLIEGVKRYVCRPRPGGEFLVAGGGFPSGHVGNVLLCGVAVLCLVLGRDRARSSRAGLAGVAAACLVIALSRVYLGRHWASDVIGTVLLVGGYASLAFLHAERRWRLGTVGVAVALSLALLAARVGGHRLFLPTGGPAEAAAAVQRLGFAAALEEGKLAGSWSEDRADPARRAVWLTGSAGTLTFAAPAKPVGELRLVARPFSGRGSACARMHVELNGVLLGDRLLHVGWRAFRFALEPGQLRPGDNVLTVSVRNGRPADGRPFLGISALSLRAP